MKPSCTTTVLILCAVAWAVAGGNGIASAEDDPTQSKVVSPNQFEGTDVVRINRAIEAAAAAGGRVVIPRENIRGDQRSDIWLLDSAILLRSNTTLQLDNCHIKLSDRCRDNFMRNVKSKDISRNIHVRGIGDVLLEGADHPRSTAYGGWTLGKQTYGTDGGIEGERQGGDARNFGILLTWVENFSLENFTIKDSHSWAIAMMKCADGTLRDLDLDSKGYKIIDGVRQRILNQDGIDVRQGCHDILIENITGHTGDDLIALTSTANADRYVGGGDIHHITLRNINGYSSGACHIIRLLNNGGVKIHDILIENLTDTTPVNPPKGELIWGPSRAAIKIGDTGYGGKAPLGDTFNVTIRNVESRARYAVLIAGTLSESTIRDVVHYGTNDPVTVEPGPESIRNVAITDVRVVKD